MIYYRIESSQFLTHTDIRIYKLWWSTIELKAFIQLCTYFVLTLPWWSTIELKDCYLHYLAYTVSVGMIYYRIERLRWEAEVPLPQLLMIYYRIESDSCYLHLLCQLRCWWSTIELKGRVQGEACWALENGWSTIELKVASPHSSSASLTARWSTIELKVVDNLQSNKNLLFLPWWSTIELKDSYRYEHIIL